MLSNEVVFLIPFIKDKCWMIIMVLCITGCGVTGDSNMELAPNGIGLGDTEEDVAEKAGVPLAKETIPGPAEEAIIYEYDSFAVVLSGNTVIAVVSYDPDAQTQRGLDRDVNRDELIKAYEEFSIYSNQHGAFYIEMAEEKWLVFGRGEFIYYGDPLMLELAGGGFDQVKKELIRIHPEKGQ